MTEKEEEYLRTRSRSQQRKKNEKLDRLLNYLIGIVVALIAIALFVIFATEPDQVETPKEHAEESAVTEEGGPSDDEVPAVSDKEDPEEELAGTDDEQESSVAGEEVDIERVDDGEIVERWTSDSWKPYPTEQEGPHASVYQKGHIDYEEKLHAVYSVIPLEQSNSILIRIQNNGSPQTSRAIVTNMDKTENYRVFIEWVDGEGWQPTMVEVLASLDGIE